MPQTFGRLTAIKEIEHHKTGRWLLLQCECGEFVRRAARDLCSVVKRGAAPACLRCAFAVIAQNGKRNRTHGLTITHPKLYGVHRQMVRRCSDPTSADWPNYGGRGIKVCADWLNASAFVAWAMAAGYEPGLTIERNDVNGHYEPANCCWIRSELQARNTRKVHRLTIGVETKTLVEWAEQHGVSVHTIKGRLQRGWAPDVAVSAPAVAGRNQTWSQS
jgi:hypothetical protein